MTLQEMYQAIPAGNELVILKSLWGEPRIQLHGNESMQSFSSIEELKEHLKKLDLENRKRNWHQQVKECVDDSQHHGIDIPRLFRLLNEAEELIGNPV